MLVKGKQNLEGDEGNHLSITFKRPFWPAATAQSFLGTIRSSAGTCCLKEKNRYGLVASFYHDELSFASLPAFGSELGLLGFHTTNLPPKGSLGSELTPLDFTGVHAIA